MREARKAGVKVGTRLNTNSIVLLFGERFKKEDIIGVVKPIERTIGGENTLYIIYEERQETCFWSRVGGIMTSSLCSQLPLRSKAETVIIIRKYNGRAQIEQTRRTRS